MKNKQNLHTHTVFCDGKDTPEELIAEAIKKGFSSIGFSIHSSMTFSTYLHTTPATMREYQTAIRALKEQYNRQIDIYCGVEAELLSDNDWTGYDYIIGSAHYLKIGEEYIGFDRDATTIANIVNRYFDGDGLKYAKMYYETLAQMPTYIDADIVGHFDLVSKHNEVNHCFDEDSKEYLQYAFTAIDALAGKVPFFEVNTGAIARGSKSTPYPSVPIVKQLLAKGFLPIISSDCHDKHNLDCAFDAAVSLLEECGATERYIFTEQGFQAVDLR